MNPLILYMNMVWIIINITYKGLINLGVKPEDARGILPTNILTNIMMNANLRTISDMITKRSSLRVQGEYREFIERMMEVVLEVHPFTEKFFCRDSKNISAEINKEIDTLPDTIE